MEEKPLRLWPGVVIVLVQWAVRFAMPLVIPDSTVYGVMAGIAGGAALVIWWLFFSRAAWSERVGGVVVMIVAVAATWPFLDISIRTGAMGMMFPIVVIPGLCLAFVVWAGVSRRLTGATRRVALVAAVALACGVWTLVRTGGFTGGFDNDFAWRWVPTPEERLLALGDPPAEAAPTGAPMPSNPPGSATADRPLVEGVPPRTAAAERTIDSSSSAPVSGSEPAASGSAFDWPGFRGRDRDGIVRGVRIDTDWSASPPIEIWRRPIGPGWSSFAVHGDLLYTQEQRGDEEIVAAYRVSTGAPVWKHRDAARFWESNGGAGPRGTPTFGNGRLFTFGATGILNVLDAADGRVVWSRNVSADSRTRVPDWGFSSSPLLVGDLVIVAAASKLVAYDAATGAPRWTGPDGGAGYSSPHALTIGGVPQVLLLDAHGAVSVASADGTKLWDVQITTSAMSAPIVQPAMTADGDVLISDGVIGGMRRVAVAPEPGGWTVAERWATTGLKPYFNDFVVHGGHAFGFDGSLLACIDLADGRRTWKGGRYGNGQLVLLADQSLLLVVSEDGELALVAAAPDKFTEIARVPAIEGKTWNHPVVVGDVLLVRNGEEMAAFRLPLARR